MRQVHRTQPGELHFELATVILDNFAGNAALYRAFQSTCARQFVLDAAAGDAACATGDFRSLQRLTHNLKSVLAMLGHGELSGLAAHVEESATQGQPASAATWHKLRSALLHLPLQAGS